jgi:hypothetical protein
MSEYADLAKRAVGLMLWEPGTDPRKAWSRAGEEVFPHSQSAREKGCPKSTFLGLCEEGLVPGAPAGSYTNSRLNKEYGLRALGMPPVSVPLLMLDLETVEGQQAGAF